MVNFVLDKCMDKLKQMKLQNLFSEKIEFEDNENNDIFTNSIKNKKHKVLKESLSMVSMQELQKELQYKQIKKKNDNEQQKMVPRANSLPISRINSLEAVPEDKPVNVNSNNRSSTLYVARSTPNMIFRDESSMTIVKRVKKEKSTISSNEIILSDIIKKENNNFSTDLNSTDASIISHISSDKKVIN